MITHRGCYFFDSDSEPDLVWVERSDGEIDSLNMGRCRVTVDANGNLVRITDVCRKVAYIPAADCPKIQ